MFAAAQSAGPVSELDLTSRTLSKDRSVVSLEIENQELLTGEDWLLIKNVKNKALTLLKNKYSLENLHTTKPVRIVRLAVRDSISDKDQHWNRQVDQNSLNQACHYTAIVQLSTYLLEFNGGRFTFIDADNITITSIQPKSGRLLVYSSGAENEHYIEKMELGEAFYLKIPFTCDSASAVEF